MNQSQDDHKLGSYQPKLCEATMISQVRKYKKFLGQSQRFAFRFAPYVCQLAILKVQSELVGWTRAGPALSVNQAGWQVFVPVRMHRIYRDG